MAAERYRVLGLVDGVSHLSGLDHFSLSAPVPCDPALVLDEAFVLHVLDETSERAVFTRSAPVADLLAAPFFYLTQRQTASEVITLSYQDLHELADELPDPERLCLLYSTGRCGSTLLGRAIGATTGVRVLSEPDAYTSLVGLRDTDGSQDADLVRLARSITRLLGHACDPVSDTGLMIKFRGWCTHIADLMQRAQPQARSVFLTRDLDTWLQSMARLSGGAPQGAFHGPSPTKFRFPRDRFVRLPTPVQPRSRVEVLAQTWATLMHSYLRFERDAVLTAATDYRTVTSRPGAAIAAVCDAYGLQQIAPEALDAVLAQDSQAGTRLSGRDLAREAVGELTEEDLRAGRAMAARCGVPATVLDALPGALISTGSAD